MLVHGGYGYQQYGGSGTIYIEDTSNSSRVYRKIVADNGGYTDSARLVALLDFFLGDYVSFVDGYAC
jgi:hypothetical protein